MPCPSQAPHNSSFEGVINAHIYGFLQTGVCTVSGRVGRSAMACSPLLDSLQYSKTLPHEFSEAFYKLGVCDPSATKLFKQISVIMFLMTSIAFAREPKLKVK